MPGMPCSHLPQIVHKQNYRELLEIKIIEKDFCIFLVSNVHIYKKDLTELLIYTILYAQHILRTLKLLYPLRKPFYSDVAYIICKVYLTVKNPSWKFRNIFMKARTLSSIFLKVSILSYWFLNIHLYTGFGSKLPHTFFAVYIYTYTYTYRYLL
jgi:hypothetical protein